MNKEDNYIKVLLISHNPFSTYQSMGKTFLSLFNSFSKEELCNFFVFPSYPNVDMTSSNYRITDKDAVKAIFSHNTVGQEVDSQIGDIVLIEKEVDDRFYLNSANKTPVKRILRDIIWKLSKWNSKQVKEWLKKEAPTCIFLAPGYAKFIYDIALSFAETLKVPIITYICDDYYFLKKSKTRLGVLQQELLKKKIRQLMSRTKLLITISEEMKGLYEKEFSVDSKVIMTGFNRELYSIYKSNIEIKRFCYFGNVGLNRNQSLADIGRVLDKINKERNTHYSLNIFTKTKSLEMNESFSQIDSICICEFVTGDKFKKEITNADCLIHVEAFNEEISDLVKCSISTKIADYLATGVPILAYGPKGIASIEHLKRNNSAYVANNAVTLKHVVEEIIENKEKRSHVSNNALITASEFHDAVCNGMVLRSSIEKIQNEYE